MELGLGNSHVAPVEVNLATVGSMIERGVVTAWGLALLGNKRVLQVMLQMGSDMVIRGGGPGGDSNSILRLHLQ